MPLKLNGLQPAPDNRPSMELAAELELPVISGGDRHGREPNADLNLSNASSFAEFVHEVRYDGVSHVLFLPQYRDPVPARYIEFLWHAAQNYSDFTGRERWIDRKFYASEDGNATLPLADLWPDGGPRLVRWLLGCVEFWRRPACAARSVARWASTASLGHD